MFGADNGGDTSGYGGLSARSACPGASDRARTAAGSTRSPTSSRAPWRSRACSPANAIEKTVVDRGETHLPHRAASTCSRVARTLRDDPALRFELCTGVSAASTTRGDKGRELHAVYHLRSITHNRLIRLEVSAPDADPHVPSLVARLPDQRLARARDLRLLRASSSTATRP